MDFGLGMHIIQFFWKPFLFLENVSFLATSIALSCIFFQFVWKSTFLRIYVSDFDKCFPFFPHCFKHSIFLSQFPFHFMYYTFLPPRIGIMVRVVFIVVLSATFSSVLESWIFSVFVHYPGFSCFKHNVTHFHPLKHHLHLKVGHSLFLFRKHNYQYEFFKLYLRITIRDRYALADEG
uniref:Uncharacterized protein n=1 Tax=Cacopsylla melanoneura TaxID=428564 RepID=A0A8D8SHP1_9HEMI